MVTAEMIKQRAKELGASICGIGDVSLFVGDDPRHNPLSVLPNAKCIIGFGIPIPKGLYQTMENKSQYYNYTAIGVKHTDEIFADLLLIRMGAMIEDEGYDACLQRSVPGMRIKGEKHKNPEVERIYELQFAEAVSSEKPAPEVIIDYNKAAMVCGLGKVGLHGKVITKTHGPYMRFVYIITDMPLKCDPPFEEDFCNGCERNCMTACPGKAISQEGLDTWQCSVYYRGAHKSNPFITEEFLKDHPERQAILNGEKRFDEAEAEKIYPNLSFLPKTQFGYVACLCGKACEQVCYKHLKELGKI